MRRWGHLWRIPAEQPRPPETLTEADEARERAWRDALKRLEEREQRIRRDLAELTMPIPRPTQETIP